MKPALNLLLIGLMLFWVLGCKETDKASSPESIYFESDAVLKAVEDLSSDAFEGRRYDTEGSQMARDLIIEGFKRHGIAPFPQGYTQPFTVEIDSSSLTATNVIGYVEGTLKPDAYIVISAHYDHEGIRDGVVYNGADDNASGVGGLLAFADYFTDNPPKHSVILAAFDAEEDGLLGAYHFVDHPPVKLEQIKANINMDMISRSDTYTMWVLGPRYYPEFRPLVTAIDSTATHKARIGPTRPIMPPFIKKTSLSFFLRLMTTRTITSPKTILNPSTRRFICSL